MTPASKTMIRSLDKKFSKIDAESFKRPLSGLDSNPERGPGYDQYAACKENGHEPARVIQMEKNEQNLKISTLEKAANAMGCKLLYVLVPQEPIEQMIHERAHAAAEKLFHKVNMNMALENQRVDSKEMIEDIAKELLDGSLSKIWED